MFHCEILQTLKQTEANKMAKNSGMGGLVLILSDARGIYIPRDFVCDSYNEIAEEHCLAWGLKEENKTSWEDAADPESEFYWESWEWILDNAKYIEKVGNKEYTYRLTQDGDLYSYCYEKMTKEEKNAMMFD